MKIVSWNVRGIGSGRKRGVIKENLLKMRPDFVVLQETKKEILEEKLVGSLWKARNRSWVALPAEGRSGGIIIIWDVRGVRVRNSLVGRFSVSIEVEEGDGSWWFTGVYGPNDYRERKEFWEELYGLHTICGPKWCLGGDFNVVRFCHEKYPLGRRTRSVRQFDELIRELALKDLALHNASFTWSNFRETPVKCRLDRFLFTEEWGAGKSDIRQETGSRTCSDHMPLILDTSPVSWGPTPFRLENMWLGHSSFRQECEKWWREIEVEGWESYKIMEKLRALKEYIKVWNKEIFGDTRIIKKEVVDKIDEIDKKEENRQLGDGERELRVRLRNQLEEITFKEMVAWRQKMKFRWIKEWDYNSAMFHRMVSYWRNKNVINRIIREDELVLTDQREIVNEIVSFYENLYKETSTGWWDFEEINWGSISVERVEWLERPFEEEEIKKAVFAKLLSNRLREVLEETISLAQGAFVHNRQILDVVLVATEAVEDYRKRGERGVIFKVDFEKAYDYVNWDFLDLVLEKKGFGVRWRSWMRGCISSANFSIMINGKPRGRFGASRGLRQGDPLSPFLFILVADILGRMMDKAVGIGEVKGFKVGREEVVVSHLQFADDTLFLLEPDKSNIEKVNTILKFFSMCSGLKINMNKSSLAGITLTEQEVGVLASEVGCEKGSWPLKYLGLPLGGNPNSAEFWNPVIEKGSKRLDGWKKAFLSKGGRLTLIQSVLSSIPTYYMSLFKLPRVVAASLEKMMREFLWDRDSTGKGRSLVRWKTVCKPKELGGLGIGNLILRNKALLGKWLWRFPLEQHSLWAVVIRSKYGLDRNGWDTNRVTSFFDCLLGNANSFNFEPFRFIWKSSVPHRVKVSAWLIYLGKLNTCDRVQRRNPQMMLSPNRCVMCKRDEESVNHLFLHCCSARFLWLKALGEVGIHWAAPASVRCMFLDRTLGYGSNNMAKTLWNCMVFSLLWHIWLERNIRIFEDKEMLLEDIFEKAKFSTLQWAFSDKSFKGFPFSLVAFNWKDVIGIS
ncbi:hypothetical protein UlMin_015740 [Ulmus minor]